MRSYLDILTELKETVMNDMMPSALRSTTIHMIDGLMELLWPYSD